MDGFRLLYGLRLSNVLSYGPKGEYIALEPLNVLIGPNGSGKSNLIEAISLLKAAPSDLTAPIRAGGGAPEWIWKGEGERRLAIEVDVGPSSVPIGTFLHYGLGLAVAGPNPQIVLEVVESVADAGAHKLVANPLYLNRDGRATLSTRVLVPTKPKPSFEDQVSEYNPPGGVSWTHSILSQLRDPLHYPEITVLGGRLSGMALFRSIGMGRDSRLRGPPRADEPASFLTEDGRNLGVVLSDLLNQPPTRKRLLSELQRFSWWIENITTKTYANTVETSLHERGFAQSIPSVRLSDGTLRYLSLLTILCHPTPPPLVCIEDPEVGLHPDILPHLAELLIEASQRMQLIVTTHSDILVSALSEVPEAVVVCERDDAGTHLRRLDKESLDEWLKKYTLGGLWCMGELGGNP